MMTNLIEKRNEFSEFLVNRNINEFRMDIKPKKYIVLKIKLTENVDQIFCCYSFGREEQKIDDYDKFETAGYIKNGVLYGSYYISEILSKLDISDYNHCFSSLSLETKIKNYINDFIINHWEYFKGQKSANSGYYKSEHAENIAENWIVNEFLEQAPDYKYNHEIELDTKDFIQYLNDGEKFISEKSDEFISQFKYSIHNTIVGWEAAVKFFNEKKDNESLIHIKNMKNKLKDLNANTVKIKIIKDSKEIIISIPKRLIDNCNPEVYIWLHYIPKPDRDLFEKTYGKHVNLYPEDIDEIFYRNKTIYKRGE